MKKLFLITIFIIAQAQGKDPSKLMTVGIFHFPPILKEKLSENDNWGYCYETNKEILKNIGYKVKPTFLSIKRLKHEVSSNTIDSICALSKGHTEDLIYSDHPIAKVIYLAWVKKSLNFKFTGMNSLKPLNLVTVAGYNYSSSLPKYQSLLESSDKVLTLSGGKPIFRAFKMIDLDRADMLVMDEYNAELVLKAMGKRDQFRSFSIGDKECPAYFGVSKKNKNAKKIIDAYNKEFLKFKESGQLRKIFEEFKVKYIY